MRYLIGSGYVNNPQNNLTFDPKWQTFADGNRLEFSKLWIDNIERYADPKPSRIVVLSCMGAQLPYTRNNLDEIHLSGDLGHFSALLDGTKPHHFNGWMGSVLALALIAYNDESDFIFLEQDCLAFGPWVKRLYMEIGDAGVMFGNYKDQGCAQSLFMVRHSYIPSFVRMILEMPRQNTIQTLGEKLFVECQKWSPKWWKRFSFGYDRGRPENGFASCKDGVFYVQQLTQSELTELRACNLLQ